MIFAAQAFFKVDMMNNFLSGSKRSRNDARKNVGLVKATQCLT
ncbi:hypothetical protein QG37_00986 [Candidozyma auris]|nr:hypothetical protein QG37_00986 [[Candida] auris]